MRPRSRYKISDTPQEAKIRMIVGGKASDTIQFSKAV